MVRIFRTIGDSIHQVNEIYEGCWVALVAPTATELLDISTTYNIDIDSLRAPLDDEERSRIEVEDGYTLIIVDIPIVEERKGEDYFDTIPCGIIKTEDMIFTICLIDTPMLEVFMDGRVRNFWTYKKDRFVLQLLHRNATMYLQYLRTINRKCEEVERKLYIATKNSELIELLELEKSLLYFTTSLRSNEIVLEKMFKMETIKRYPEDAELLEDVIIENKQAMEMSRLYSGVLNGTTDAYASIISNNLNIVMKFLAVVTLVMNIPTIVGGFWGMNVPGVPYANDPNGFWKMITITVLLTVIGTWYFAKNKMFK